MPQRPTRNPKHGLQIFCLEDAVINTLLIGQYYADIFANIIQLATTIQNRQASNLDSTPDVAQLLKIAEESRAELELQLVQIREFLDGFASQAKVHTVKH